MTCFLFFSQVLVILWSLDQRRLALLFTIFGHSRKTRLVISSLVKRLKLVKVLTLCQAPPLCFRYITGKTNPYLFVNYFGNCLIVSLVPFSALTLLSPWCIIPTRLIITTSKQGSDLFKSK